MQDIYRIVLMPKYCNVWTYQNGVTSVLCEATPFIFLLMTVIRLLHINALLPCALYPHA